MGKIIRLDSKGRIVYDGMLSSQEKATIDEILNSLKIEIPEIELELGNMYGNSVWYKYNLGKFLDEILQKYDISISERRLFWDEIKYLASENIRKRNEGKKAATRSFYQQCYVLSQFDKEVVEKLTWRQWQDLLDRVGNREDERIFDWLRRIEYKIREDDWREFEKALNLYLKNKDTSVFNTEELFAIYDSLMLMASNWRIMFREFSARYPKSQKIKSKGNWSKKYYAKCFELKKKMKLLTVTDEMCKESFNGIMINKSKQEI